MKNIKTADEIKDFLWLKDLGDISILLVEDFDYGQKSPFTIERVNIYILKPGQSSFEQISEGICHYNPQIDTLFLSLFFIVLLLSSYLIPILLGWFDIIQIPEACKDFMSSMICPLAYIIAIVMPFIVNIIP